MDIAAVEALPEQAVVDWQDFAHFQLQVEPAGGRICEPYSRRACPRGHGDMRLHPVPARRSWFSIARRARWECVRCGCRR